MENFQKSLANMKRACLPEFQGPEYWNVVLEEGETPLSSVSNATEISLRTKEGFIIKIRLMDMKPYMCNINGYLSLPRGLHLESWLKDNPSYEDLNYHLYNMKVELTYGSAKDLEYGWDHAHAYDANLGVPMAQQFQKQVSGPVQVLEEARFLIRSIMDKENEILQKKKKEQMGVLEEDLMKMAVHPKRVESWVKQGFDPFAEES
jgi:hypothetical protein